MPIRVFFSKRADQQHTMLRKRDRERIANFVGELKANGCKALAYRLSGTSPIDRLCVRHPRKPESDRGVR
jgi:mRNA-degrading endonuclease RelE of RelBE toxin-antitoxin system